MLEERSVIDQITILEDGQMQVRRADKIFRDGVEIAKSYHRHVINPGDNLTDEDVRVQVVGRVVHTQDVVQAFVAAQARRSEASL